MDYLPIQALSVPCERVFSSSAETATKKHNQIGPTLMEALQMLKYHLKKTRLDFCANWTTSHDGLVKDEPEEPDDGGMKQEGDFDIHDRVEDLVRKSEIEDGAGLSDYVIVYKCDTFP